MNNPLEITFRDIPPSQRVEDLINEKFNKIQSISNGVVRCRVIMKKLSKHHKKGNAYCVSLDIKLAHFPDIIVNEESKEGERPLTSAVREVFKRAHELVRKQIERRKKRVPSQEYPISESGVDEEEVSIKENLF